MSWGLIDKASAGLSGLKGAIAGAVGGGVAAGFAVAALWPVIVTSVSGAGGVFLALLATITIIGASVSLGTVVGAVGLGCLYFFRNSFTSLTRCDRLNCP